MTDFSNKSYFELKAIIKEENSRTGEQVMSAKGTKQELLARVENYNWPTPSQEPSVENSQDHQTQRYRRHPALKQKNPDVLVAEAPNLTPEEAELISDTRLESLALKLRRVLSDKADFDFSLNPEKGAYTVQLSGGVRGKKAQTLIASDNDILKFANHYIMRTHGLGTNGAVSRL